MADESCNDVQNCFGFDEEPEEEEEMDTELIDDWWVLVLFLFIKIVSV